MKNKGFTIIELMIVVMIIGILAAIATPNFINMMARAKDAGVKSNSHTVQVAAEDFAVQSGGTYANDLSAVTPAGLTIIDALPQDQRLLNPFTRARTEPVDGAAAALGETGYEPVVDGTGANIGYIITGQGSGGQEICRYTNGI
jgi:prepilin-type N-terminal cleavage/methylation domain-containing protein